jgi:hypothetical protein
LSTSTGRFSSQDTEEGVGTDPLSPHKHLYGKADPVNQIDPTGQYSIAELAEAAAIVVTLSVIPYPTLGKVLKKAEVPFRAYHYTSDAGLWAS